MPLRPDVMYMTREEFNDILQWASECSACKSKGDLRAWARGPVSLTIWDRVRADGGGLTPGELPEGAEMLCGICRARRQAAWDKAWRAWRGT